MEKYQLHRYRKLSSLSNAQKILLSLIYFLFYFSLQQTTPTYSHSNMHVHLCSYSCIEVYAHSSQNHNNCTYTNF